MTRSIRFVSVIAAVFASAVLLAAQTSENDPFVGTWKLNVAKSKFNPGPAPKSETVTITPDKVSVEAVNTDGNTVNWSYMHSGETAAKIDGMENSTVMEKRSGNTVDHTWNMNGNTETGHGVISKNGKTMKYTMTGTNAQGQKVHNVLIFEKE